MDELESLHIDALAEHLYPRSVAIIHHDANDLPTQGYSSGTCVTIGGRHFVATAGHVVIDEKTNNLVTDLRSFAVAALGKVGQRSRATPKVIRSGGRYDAVTDVGWLELEPKAIESWTGDWSRVFVTIDEFSLDPVTDKHAVMLLGQPGDQVDNDPKSQLVGLNPQPYLADVIPLPPGGRVGDVYVRYEKTMGTKHGTVAAPAAPGMSGSGVYLVTQKMTGPIWTPTHARLVAIQSAWREYECLRSSPIRHWLELLRKDLPELGADIDPLLATP